MLGGSRLKAGMTVKISFALFIIFIIFSLYSFNLKPLLAANYANQILSLPAAQATQATSLLEETLALKTFASPEIIYQTVLDYLDKANSVPQLTQNEEFYKLVDRIVKSLTPISR